MGRVMERDLEEGGGGGQKRKDDAGKSQEQAEGAAQREEREGHQDLERVDQLRPVEQRAQGEDGVGNEVARTAANELAPGGRSP